MALSLYCRPLLPWRPTMKLRDLLRRRLPRLALASRRRGLRLHLEHLEDRTVPANFTAGSVSELIAAIDHANQNSQADTITLVPGTTFTLTEVDNTTLDATGLPVITATDN